MPYRCTARLSPGHTPLRCLPSVMAWWRPGSRAPAMGRDTVQYRGNAAVGDPPPPRTKKAPSAVAEGPLTRNERGDRQRTAATLETDESDAGALGGIRTPDSGLRKPQLYPLSYEGTQDSPGSLPAPSIPAPRLIVRTLPAIAARIRRIRTTHANARTSLQQGYYRASRPNVSSESGSNSHVRALRARHPIGRIAQERLSRTTNLYPIWKSSMGSSIPPTSTLSR